MALPLVRVNVSLRYDDSCAVCVSCMFCEAMALPFISVSLRYDDSCAVCVSCVFCEDMALPLVSVSVSLRFDDSCAVCVSCMFCEAMALPLVSVSLPSKHAGSDSHPVRISSEALVRSGPDDSCTPPCFRTGCVWSNPDTVSQD